MTLIMSFIAGQPLGDHHVRKPFLPTEGFKSTWWTDIAAGPLQFVTFSHDVDGEVARAEVKMESFTGTAFPDWDRPESGVTEVQLFEVRGDLRGRGYGRKSVEVLLAELQGPVIAVALDQEASEFWRQLGWTEYPQEPDPYAHVSDEKPRPLFVWN